MDSKNKGAVDYVKSALLLCKGDNVKTTQMDILKYIKSEIESIK